MATSEVSEAVAVVHLVDVVLVMAVPLVVGAEVMAVAADADVETVRPGKAVVVEGDKVPLSEEAVVVAATILVKVVAAVATVKVGVVDEVDADLEIAVDAAIGAVVAVDSASPVVAVPSLLQRPCQPRKLNFLLTAPCTMA